MNRVGDESSVSETLGRRGLIVVSCIEPSHTQTTLGTVWGDVTNVLREYIHCSVTIGFELP